jgi:hypothetical protein
MPRSSRKNEPVVDVRTPTSKLGKQMGAPLGDEEHRQREKERRRSHGR